MESATPYLGVASGRCKNAASRYFDKNSIARQVSKKDLFAEKFARFTKRILDLSEVVPRKRRNGIHGQKIRKRKSL